MILRGYELLQLLFFRSAQHFSVPLKFNVCSPPTQALDDASTKNNLPTRQNVAFNIPTWSCHISECNSLPLFPLSLPSPILWLIYRIFYVKLYILPIPFLFPFYIHSLQKRVVCLYVVDENDPAIYIEYDNKQPIDEGLLRLWMLKYWFDWIFLVKFVCALHSSWSSFFVVRFALLM